jgi:hypothetical protein
VEQHSPTDVETDEENVPCEFLMNFKEYCLRLRNATDHPQVLQTTGKWFMKTVYGGQGSSHLFCGVSTCNFMYVFLTL